MSSELMDALRALARDKNIDENEMLTSLEDALGKTYHRILEMPEAHSAKVTIDRETGSIKVFELVPVGGTEEEPVYEEHDVTPQDVSRLAAHEAKGVITSSIRNAERERIFEEYADRVGESVTGTVQQGDPRNVLIKLREGVEALPRRTHQRQVPAVGGEVRDEHPAESARGPGDHGHASGAHAGASTRSMELMASTAASSMPSTTGRSICSSRCS